MGRNVSSLLAREKVTSLAGRRVPRRTSRGGRREGGCLPAGGALEAHTSCCCSDPRAGRAPEAIIKNAAPGLPARPPTCPAIRHTKVGETSLWMMSPKDRASSQACFLLHVPQDTELRRASSHPTSGKRPWISRVWPQSQGFSGCPSHRQRFRGLRCQKGLAHNSELDGEQNSGVGPEPRVPASPCSPRPYTCG